MISEGLLNRRRGINLYRGFESPPLRQTNQQRAKSNRDNENPG